MNIFVLDMDVKSCAQANYDRHMVKMCLEYAQILYTDKIDGKIIEASAQYQHKEAELADLRARLEKAERDAEYRLDTLKEVRETLEVANVTPNGPINDTIWYSNCETLFDFMDAAIAKERT